jgi:hypothetical protein
MEKAAIRLLMNRASENPCGVRQMIQYLRRRGAVNTISGV